MFNFRSLCPALQENGKFKEAAELVRQFQNDDRLVIKLLCDGRHYQEAIYETKTKPELLGEF